MADLSFEQFISELEGITDDIESEIEQGLNEVAEDLLGQAVNLAPLEHGFLRQSGSVDTAKRQGDDIVTRTGFNTEYALKMHEDFYTPSHHGTGRKYLERPTMLNAERYSEHLFGKVKKVFEK